MPEIKLDQKHEPGKLRIYIGAAPGVGKTYVMLNDAPRLVHQEGVDVVIGLVEPHGREETRSRIRDLEIIPLKVIPYRGVELQEMDVDAMTTVNIQHIETLNDAVNRSANTVIRETVPDSFLKRADEVVNVDVTVNELRNRLRQGKIYAQEKIEQSLANFFRIGNLNLLRELALRTTAEQVSSREAAYRRTQGLEQAQTP